MNKLLKTLVATVVCLGAVYAYGEDPYEEIDGIKWYYSVSNEEATVTRIWSSRDGNSPSGDLVVPGTLGEAPVARIARYTICPYGNSGLTSVTFPDSMRKIGTSAFEGCSALSNVDLNANLDEIGSYAFRNCKSLTSLSVPDAVIKLGKDAFAGCTRLTPVSCEEIEIAEGNDALLPN